MNDTAIASTLVQVEAAEQGIRAAWEQAARANEVDERDDTLKVLREAIAFKRALERWITARSRRTVGSTVSS